MLDYKCTLTNQGKKMSNTAFNWAFEQELPYGAKFLLVAIANHKNEKASIDSLIERTGMSKRTVIKNLKICAQKNLISITKLENKINYYTLNGEK
jgi:DNA-binding MarR family transcriptional regulator